MKSRIVIIACFAFLAMPLGAQEGRREMPVLTYGIEWNYAALFNAAWHHNYLGDGGRVNDKRVNFLYENHGEILAHFGVNVGRRVNLSLYCGYSGVIKDVRIVPVSLRCKWFYGKSAHYGHWFSFVDGGSGIVVSDIHTPYYSGKIGAGYRVPLSRSVKLDFNIAYRLAYASPDITDRGEAVPEHNIRRNDNYLSALMLGIGLTF